MRGKGTHAPHAQMGPLSVTYTFRRSGVRQGKRIGERLSGRMAGGRKRTGGSIGAAAGFGRFFHRFDLSKTQKQQNLKHFA